MPIILVMVHENEDVFHGFHHIAMNLRDFDRFFWSAAGFLSAVSNRVAVEYS